MARVYLETSFFSACVSTRTSAKSVAWRETSIEWWRTQVARHELYVSDEAVAELSDPDFLQGPAALEMLRDLRLLELGPDVRGLAQILVREKVMPGPAVSGDALHVAAADRDARFVDGVRRMSNVKPSPRKVDENPVDDVRRVRRKLSEETGNDVNRLADRARQATEKLREQLGLKPAKP